MPEETAPTRLTEAKGTSLAREIFTSNFWMSGLAIVKYIPRSFRVKQLDGMAFYTDAKYDEFRNRVLQTTAANPRQWGTMSVAQMLHHLNLACGGSLAQIRRGAVDNGNASSTRILAQLSSVKR